MADFGIGEALLADAAGEAAIADAVGLSTADLIGSGAIGGAGAGAAGALTAADLVGSGAITDLTPSVASGAFDTGGFEGISGLGQAVDDPVTRAIRAANMANVTGSAPGAFQGITELDAAQTADLMKNIDPRMVDTLQPVVDKIDYSSIEDTMPAFNSGPVSAAAAAPSYLDQALSFANKYKTPLMLGAGALGIKSLLNADKQRYGINQQALQPYSGPLSKFSYDPAKYTPAPNPAPVYYKARYATGGISSTPQNERFDAGGIAQLAVGGKLLRGQGDGMSDSIKANISGRQEARLADGEFVVPADVVSHLGNGSTDAGAKQLYSMMDKVRQARTGRKAQGRQIAPQKYMPA